MRKVLDRGAAISIVRPPIAGAARCSDQMGVPWKVSAIRRKQNILKKFKIEVDERISKWPDGNLSLRNEGALWKLHCTIDWDPQSTYSKYNKTLVGYFGNLPVVHESLGSELFSESLILAQNERWRRG